MGHKVYRKIPKKLSITPDFWKRKTTIYIYIYMKTHTFLSFTVVVSMLYKVTVNTK